MEGWMRINQKTPSLPRTEPDREKLNTEKEKQRKSMREWVRMDQKTPSPPGTELEIERESKIQKTASIFGETKKESRRRQEQEKLEKENMEKKNIVREMVRKMEGENRQIQINVETSLSGHCLILQIYRV